VRENKWEKRFLFDIHSDSTPVPNLLLKYYHQLGLSEPELVFLIQLLMLEGKGGPAEIGEVLHLDPGVVKQHLAALIEKGIIVPENMRQGSNIISCYYFDGLYDKLIEIWAFEMAGKKEAAATVPDYKGANQVFSLVFQSFEKEFGRPLSPMENDKILEWLDEFGYGPELILESLKRAVLRGIYNFNYIDKILLEWHKSNIRTLDQVISHEKGRRGKEKPSGKKEATKRNQDLKNLYEL